MGFAEAVKAFFSNYVKFDGRSARSEFWWAMLGLVIINILIMVITMVSEALGGILSLVFTLGIIIPYIAIGIRRFHDVDKSGWWVLTLLIPLVGLIIILIFFTQKGTTGSNRFGPDPLGNDAAVFN